jgi:molecular chaperone HtpG
VMHLTEFSGKPLQSVAKGALDLGALDDKDAKKAQEQSAGQLKNLLDRMKAALGERVKDVRVTHRLTSSPACLVSDEHDVSANLERLLKAAGQQPPARKPILELNPEHALVERLKAEGESGRFSDLSLLLLDQALLAEGGQLEDPAGFVRRLNELLLALAAK